MYANAQAQSMAQSMGMHGGHVRASVHVRKPGNVSLSLGNHVLFAILTLITGGLAAPVWIYMAINGKRDKS